MVAKLEGLVTDWCEQMERLFNEAESPAGGGGDDGEVQGPRSELEHWRSRMGNRYISRYYKRGYCLHCNGGGFSLYKVGRNH